MLPLRRWPPLRYVELARRLLERYPDLFVGLTGAPAEAARYNQLADEVGSNRVIPLAGKTTLRPASRYITTFPLTGHIFGGPIPGFDTRSRILPGAWATLERDFAKHPPTYIIDVQADPRTAPVKNFPILAKLLAERFQPVAHTAEGVIYRMR